MTNFVAGLAQCEAAMELFRKAGDGHLVVVSSMSAMRGQRGNTTTYAATKAGIATLAEGIRSDTLGSKIKVTTVYPGYVRSEMTDRVKAKQSFIVSTEDGARAMVNAIDREVPEAEVPPWPWRPFGVVMRHAPLGVVRKLS
jgi:short-subunit dehydrogenase